MIHEAYNKEFSSIPPLPRCIYPLQFAPLIPLFQEELKKQMMRHLKLDKRPTDEEAGVIIIKTLYKVTNEYLGFVLGHVAWLDSVISLNHDEESHNNTSYLYSIPRKIFNFAHDLLSNPLFARYPGWPNRTPEPGSVEEKSAKNYTFNLLTKGFEDFGEEIKTELDAAAQEASRASTSSAPSNDTKREAEAESAKH